jgi:diguanylate cyclase (GGDEF)-like protein
MKIRDIEKNYTELASANRDAINKYNEKMLSACSLIGAILMLLPLLAVPFSNTKKDSAPSYIIAAVLYCIVYFLFKIPNTKKFTLGGLYFCFIIIFSQAIYLSVVHTPNMRATILLGVFALMPLCFIDRPIRKNLFVAFWLILHTGLTFYLKPQYALDDLINCLCFAILGCFLGAIVTHGRIEGFDAQRLLKIETETDVLTGFYNRRKLFETLSAMETSNAEKPSGIMMVDIDHFKEYNDKYSHPAGDRCLKQLGEEITKFAKSFRMDIYRYGGEEFTILAYGYGEKELITIAESLRIAIHGSVIDGRQISVSIGVAYWGAEDVQNYEDVIARADRAVYYAKSKGRNQVCADSGDVMI